MCSRIVVSRAWDNVGVYVICVNGRSGEVEALWVGAEYRCVCGELAGELRKVV